MQTPFAQSSTNTMLYIYSHLLLLLFSVLPLLSLIFFFSCLHGLIFSPYHPSFSFLYILFIFHLPLFISPALFPFLPNLFPACLLSFLLPPALISLPSSFSPSPPCFLVYHCRLLQSIIPSVNEQINLIALSFGA